MNKKYFLRELRKANQCVIDTYNNLVKYDTTNNNKYLYMIKEDIMKTNEILTNLKINIEMEDINNETN